MASRRFAIAALRILPRICNRPTRREHPRRRHPHWLAVLALVVPLIAFAGWEAAKAQLAADVVLREVTAVGSPGEGDGQFRFPGCVAVDSQGRIVVADTFNDRIQVFDSGGDLLLTIGRYGFGEGELGTPQGVAVDREDRIIVADTFNHRVQVFDSTGRFLFAFGSPGSGDGEFDAPRGVAVNADGQIVVADTGNNRVQVFDGSGVFLYQFGEPGAL